MVMIFYRHCKKWHISYYLCWGRGKKILLALIEKNVVAFPFKMQAFASHGCPCSDHVSGVMPFSVVLVDMNTAVVGWFDPFSNGWISAPKTANNSE